MALPRIGTKNSGENSPGVSAPGPKSCVCPKEAQRAEPETQAGI